MQSHRMKYPITRLRLFLLTSLFENQFVISVQNQLQYFSLFNCKPAPIIMYSETDGRVAFMHLQYELTESRVQRSVLLKGS